MFAIDMGGCDIVLGADWLRTLGPILMDFLNLTMKFDQGGHQYKFQGITTGSPEDQFSSHGKTAKKRSFWCHCPTPRHTSHRDPTSAPRPPSPPF
jgi:hypothetical protein